MLKLLTIRARLIFVIGFMCVPLICGAVIGLVALGLAHDAAKTIYDDRLVAMGQLDRVLRFLNVNEFTVARAISGDPAAVDRQMDLVEANIQAIGKTFKSLKSIVFVIAAL